MRRTGKTYFLYQVMAEAVETGTPKEAMLYVNFDDERLQPLTGGDLHRVVDAYYRLYPERRAATAHLFFDEIQNIPGWEPFVRRLLDTEQVQVCLTGSSAKLLSREIEYYRNARGEEVDFLSTDLRGERTLTQVALETTDPATRKRELRALAAAMDELHLDHATLVTLNEEEPVATDAGTIDIIPAWRWCLAPP